MAESSKMFSFFGPGVTQRGVLISGSLALAGMVLSFAPVLPQPNLWQALGTPSVAPAAAPMPNSTWAGHLESPGTAAADAGASHALTSASYTTGFDSADAAPLPATSLKTRRRESGRLPQRSQLHLPVEGWRDIAAAARSDGVYRIAPAARRRSLIRI